MSHDTKQSGVSADSQSVKAFRREDIEGPLAIGNTFTFSKTVGEFDIYQFAGVSGDFSPNHVDEEYMRQTRYGQRIAHGVLAMAYISTVSAKVVEATGNQPIVTYGFDRVRFIKPIFISDTVTVTLTITERDDVDGRIANDVTVHNDRGELVAVARHILKAI